MDPDCRRLLALLASISVVVRTGGMVAIVVAEKTKFIGQGYTILPVRSCFKCACTCLWFGQNYEVCTLILKNR